MMGTKERYFAPLINVSIEQLVPHDHFYQLWNASSITRRVREFIEKTYTQDISFIKEE